MVVLLRGSDSMREWCSCGAAIRARRRDVLTWRTQHTCPDRPTDQVHISTGAIVEHSGARYFDGEMPIVTARIGFAPTV